jgi:hypothetical protein
VLPYWGSIKQRKILRKVIYPHLLYSKHAPFHVLVTSYQTIVTDKSIFGKIKWEYMVLDEAQAIKSAHRYRRRRDWLGLFPGWRFIVLFVLGFVFVSGFFFFFNFVVRILTF